MVPGKRRRGRNSRPYTHSIRKSLLIRDIQCFSNSPLFIVVFSFFFFLHLQQVSPFSFSLRVRLSFLFLVPSYRILLLCRYYRIAGESQARSDLRGFSSSTYLSVSSPTTFFLLFSLLPRGGRRFCQRTPSFSIDRLPTGHRWCVSFFFFFLLFLRFQRNTSLLAVRRSRCIDRSPRDSPSIRALFRGFSEALDLEYSRHPSLQLCGRSSNLAVL